MIEYQGEQDLLNSQYALFNQLVRNKGAAFDQEIGLRISQLVANGADRADATRTVIEAAIREGGDLDQLKADLQVELRKLISQGTSGVFQRRLEFHAEPGEELVWVSVMSSATCSWKPSSRKYRFQGRPMEPTDFCDMRHGMRGTTEFWDEKGRPRTGATVCLANCECTLVPASFARDNPSVLEPVDLVNPYG